MKYRTIIALLAFIVSIQGYAVQNVGGGSAVVCRNRDNAIVRAELLDIFEGQKRFGMTIPAETTDPTIQVQDALDKLGSKPAFAAYVTQIYTDVYAHRTFLPLDTALQTSNDLGTDYPAYILDGCHLEQIGYYESDGQLSIATNVYNHLSPTAQAGFWLHETLYRLTRTLADATDSAGARKLTAELLATSIPNEQAASDVAKALNEGSSQFFLILHPVAQAKFYGYVETCYIISPRCGNSIRNVFTIVRTDGSKSEVQTNGRVGWWLLLGPEWPTIYNGDNVQDIYITAAPGADPSASVVRQFSLYYGTSAESPDTQYLEFNPHEWRLPLGIHIIWEK